MVSEPTHEDIRRLRIVHPIPADAAVRVMEGQIYKNTHEYPLCFDLYAPSAEGPARAAVILIHGGPISRLGARRLGVFVSYGELLASAGLIGIAFDHRFLSAEHLPTAASDVADLISHVRGRAGALGIDPGRLALWAFSGGGALLAAVLRDRPAWCKLLVAYYPMMEGPGNAQQEQYSTIAALGTEASGAPPMLLARAGRDASELNSTIDRFAAAALASGLTLDLLTHPSGRHGFDILDANDRSAQIIRRTLAALQCSLGGGVS